MTDRKQPHPQRCETCKKYSERTHPIYEGNIIAFCGEERTQVETKAITCNHGCASHSSQPVVEFTAYGDCPSNTDRCPEIDCDTCRKSINSSQAVPETMPDIGRGGCLCDSCLADCIRHNVRQQEERR